MASIKTESLETRYKYDIFEGYLNQNTHGGCLGHFLIYIAKNVSALNSQDC